RCVDHVTTERVIVPLVRRELDSSRCLRPDFGVEVVIPVVRWVQGRSTDRNRFEGPTYEEKTLPFLDFPGPVAPSADSKTLFVVGPINHRATAGPNLLTSLLPQEVANRRGY